MLDAYDDCVDVECGLDAVDWSGVEAFEPESSVVAFVCLDKPDAVDLSPAFGDLARTGRLNSVNSTNWLT